MTEKLDLQERLERKQKEIKDLKLEKRKLKQLKDEKQQGLLNPFMNLSFCLTFSVSLTHFLECTKLPRGGIFTLIIALLSVQ